MSKPKILIAMHYLELGGAEAALIGLLQTLDPARVDVDLFLYRHSGPYMEAIPDWVRLLDEIPEYASIESSFFEALRRSPRVAFRRLRAKVRFRHYLRRGGSVNCATHFIMDELIDVLPSLHSLGKYDLAVSFLDPPHVVQDKVLAEKKVEWIHTDFSTIPYDADLTSSRWAANDAIISISDEVTRSFTRVFPSLSNKICKIENIIAGEIIKAKADTIPEEYRSIQDDVAILVTVGRLNTPQKNILSIPIVASLLCKRGVKFKWFIIGPGNPEQLDRLIVKLNVSECVKYIGARNNPYPYIGHCDLYVQPSLYEGKSIAVREAQILGKPVVITAYPTASSQVNDGKDGVICGMDNASIAKEISHMLDNKELYNKITGYLSSHDYCLREEVEKFYQLFR